MTTNQAMDWPRLMSRNRFDSQGKLDDEPEDGSVRSAFERDWDRVLFSTAFRRLHDKTQVFPLPEDDLVHSRLTHSLEVASVGRSLGRLVGKHVVQSRGLEPHLTAHHFGDVVAAACLAHDIGNPPLGHAGEDAIGAFFRSERGKELLCCCEPRQREDLQAFEGNAQGFRVLVRLSENDKGLQLTAATLASFLKYPRAAGDDLKAGRNVTRKKHGFCQSERSLMTKLAEEVGLNEVEEGQVWARHPLAFLVEAADDICYSILDIEDGVRLGLVDAPQAAKLLRSIAEKHQGYKESRGTISEDERSAVPYLRSMAIKRMINECKQEFIDHESDIMSGAHEKALTDTMPSHDSLEALKKLARKKCYSATDVLELELVGYEALGGLLECFVPAAIARYEDQQVRTVRSLLRSRNVRLEDEPSDYQRIMRVVDFVSGMTDRFALAMYRRIKGISIPGRVG